MSVGTNIYVEFGIPTLTTKSISQDLFPLVGGTAGSTCSLGASFSGQPSGPPGTYIGSAYVNSGSSSDLRNSVARDNLGNIYIAGSFGGPCSITNSVVNPTGSANAGTLPVTVATAAFVAKWNSLGVYQGSAYVDGGSNEQGYSVACDGDNNVYLVGNYGSQSANISNFGINPSGTAGTLPATAGGTGAFIAKWDSGGVYLGSAKVDGVGLVDQGISVACDGFNNVYLAGRYGSQSATISNFGTPPSGTAGTLPATAGSNSAFIAKWNSGGTYLGSAKVDGTADDEGYGVACDVSNNVYLSGLTTNGTNRRVTNFGINPSGVAGTITGTGTCLFISKWNSGGTYLGTALVVNASGAIRGGGIACNFLEDVYLTGIFQNITTAKITDFSMNPSTTTFVGTLPLSGGLSGAFVAKWNSLGVYQGSAYVDGPGIEQGISVACDFAYDPNVYLVGNYGSQSANISNFGINPSGTAGTLPATAGDTGAFIAKWNLDGVYLGSAKVDGTAREQGRGVVCDFDNNVYLAGMYGLVSTGAVATISNFGTPPSGTAGTLPSIPGSGVGIFISKWKI